ncbi:Dabb family protein [Thiospirochaeta perfilievii]|uniref:Dabb family protein n=1 Tax=Thiospirochaeta perfilievii TaxID=252967 RepID=A0A5C1QBL4_9SPIO|nr:Dabb family protein [Thiospirochaeta perfilievii]QEN05465.1 Dabb family protein [Thiospirochaeta perfilievii]
MVKHVVMWRLKNKEDGVFIREEILSLEGKIPGLVSIEAGLDFNQSGAAYDLVLISTHIDREALAIYQDHPEHVRVKNIIVPLVGDRGVVDFDI